VTAPHTAEGLDPLIGHVLNRQFEILSLIGTGGMGAVYRARQLSVNREVAVKVLRLDRDHGENAAIRFENESKIVSRLRHPNTLRLFDCQRTEDGRLFLVTELLAGAPLSRVMRAEALSIDRIVKILEQICGSLSEAHRVGIVHRDIKPQNIFIDRVGAEDVVKVLDFGIAKLAGSDSLTGSGVIGTAHYMAPEQASGADVDARADIYSLGTMVYLMLDGRLPFHGSTPVSVLYQHIHNEPPPLGANVPPALAELVMAMLAKDPDRRPQSMDDVRNRLAAIDPSVRALTLPIDLGLIAPTFVSNHIEPPRRSPRLWLLGAALFVMSAAGVVIGYRATVPEIAPFEVPTLKPQSVRAPDPRPAGRPVTRIASTPQGAKVFDPEGRLIGITPMTLDRPSDGTYRLLIEGRPTVELALDTARDLGRALEVDVPAAPPPPALPKPKKARARVAEPKAEEPVDVAW
jgi:serine/threonine protein kinase